MDLSPIPTQIIRTTTTSSKFGILSLFRFAWRHWFIISFFIFLLPTIISSIQIARETNNPSYPFVMSGLAVINADNELDKTVDSLKDNPIELKGEKPDTGLWNKTKYYWNQILLYWQIIGLVFLVIVPFKIAYSFFKFKGDRAGYDPSIWENLRKSFIIGFIFIFFVNLIIVIVGLSNGTLLMNIPNGTVYEQTWKVIVKTIPFHGVCNLIIYLISILSI